MFAAYPLPDLLNIFFFCPPAATDEVATLTVLVVADLDSEEGLELVKETLRSMVGRLDLVPLLDLTCSQTETSVTRVSFVHNPSTDTPPATTTTSSLLGTLITKGTLSNLSPAKLLEVLDSTSNIAAGQSEQVIVLSVAALEELLDGAPLVAPDEFVRASRYVLRALKVAPGENALIVNGRVRQIFDNMKVYVQILIDCCRSSVRSSTAVLLRKIYRRWPRTSCESALRPLWRL